MEMLCHEKTKSHLLFFFPQHIVEGLLNSRRRVSDRPSWILISKTPARKLKIVVCFLIPQTFNAELKAEPYFRYTYIFKSRRKPILGTEALVELHDSKRIREGIKKDISGRDIKSIESSNRDLQF